MTREGDTTSDRAPIAADMERARVEFHRLLAEAADQDAWTRPTCDTRWTTEQLLFHMVFGYMVVQRLLLLVKVVSRLPVSAGRVFARALNAAAKPFDVVNYYGSCAAALVFNRRRMGAQLDRVTASLERRLARESDESLRRGMNFPTRWDPFFEEYMTVADVYRFAGRHFDFHKRQLTFTHT